MQGETLSDEATQSEGSSSETIQGEELSWRDVVFELAVIQCKSALALFDTDWGSSSTVDRRREYKRKVNRIRAGFRSERKALTGILKRLIDNKVSQRGRIDVGGYVVYALEDGIHIFFGGVGKPVGEGHGHVAIGYEGRVAYRRNPGEYRHWYEHRKMQREQEAARLLCSSQ